VINDLLLKQSGWRQVFQVVEAIVLEPKISKMTLSLASKSTLLKNLKRSLAMR
jgi:hypothetical protein